MTGAEIADNVYAQWGAIGILVSSLAVANVAQWRLARKKDDEMTAMQTRHDARLAKVHDDVMEYSSQQTSALVELVTLTRAKLS